MTGAGYFPYRMSDISTEVSSAPVKSIVRSPLALIRLQRLGFNSTYPCVVHPEAGHDQLDWFQNHPPLGGTQRVNTGSVLYSVIVSATSAEPFPGALTHR